MIQVDKTGFKQTCLQIELAQPHKLDVEDVVVYILGKRKLSDLRKYQVLGKKANLERFLHCPQSSLLIASDVQAHVVSVISCCITNQPTIRWVKTVKSLFLTMRQRVS